MKAPARNSAACKLQWSVQDFIQTMPSTLVPGHMYLILVVLIMVVNSLARRSTYGMRHHIHQCSSIQCTGVTEVEGKQRTLTDRTAPQMC